MDPHPVATGGLDGNVEDDPGVFPLQSPHHAIPVGDQFVEAGEDAVLEEPFETTHEAIDGFSKLVYLGSTRNASRANDGELLDL